MPFVKDPRGMSAIGLVLGLAVFLVLEWGDPHDTTDKMEVGLEGAVLLLGIVSLVLAETAAAEVLLAVFMASLLVVALVKLTDHAGVLHLAHHPSGTA